MSAITVRSSCVACGQEISILKCESCWQIGFSNQSVVHCEETNKHSNETKVNQEIVSDEKVKAQQQQQHTLIQQVDDWECNAIDQIRQTAEEARRLIRKHTIDRISQVEEKLSKLVDQLRQCHQESNFVSNNVSQWQAELVKLSQQLVAPSRITVRQVPSPLMTKILVDIPALISIPSIAANAKWIQNATTVAGGNGGGTGLNQFMYTCGLYVDDDDQTIYVADYANHRVVEWKSGATSGQVVAGGNGQGNQANQLSSPIAVIVDKETDSLIICDYSNKRVVRWPRRNSTSGETIISDIASFGLTMDNDGYLYVCDWNKHEVKRWKIGETNGTVVAGGNGQGNRLDQLNNPFDVFVDQDHSVYASDASNHRVMKWMEGAKEGIVVAGGQGAGNGLTQLNSPCGMIVDHLGTVYMADFSNHRVIRWPKGAKQGSVVVGGNGRGAQANQLYNCWYLSFDQQGNLYVSDYNNHRVQKFNIDPNSIQ